MTLKKWVVAGTSLGWLGIGAWAWWAVEYYGPSLLAGADIYWILPLVCVGIASFAVAGVKTIRGASRRDKGSTGARVPGVSFRKRPLVVGVLGLLLFASGTTMVLGGRVEAWRARTRYDATRALLLDPAWTANASRVSRRAAVTGVMADYDLEPRLGGSGPGADAPVDVPFLVRNCEEVGVNCYHFLAWHRASDWADFQAFVRAAEQSPTLMARNFTCWLYLVPPSEAHDRASEPFGVDFVAWMNACAAFAAAHPVVSAVCIDDFYGARENRALFTPTYLAEMRAAADVHDPTLALVTVLYWGDVDPADPARAWSQAAAIAPHVDGILYPYMDQSTGPKNHQDVASLGSEVTRVRSLYPGIPVVLDIYASKHSGCAEFPDAAYVGALLDGARATCDGVALYCGPKRAANGTFANWHGGMVDPAGIFNATRTRFEAWSTGTWPAHPAHPAQALVP